MALSSITILAKQQPTWLSLPTADVPPVRILVPGRWLGKGWSLFAVRRGFGCPGPYPLRRSPLSEALRSSVSAVEIGAGHFRTTGSPSISMSITFLCSPVILRAAQTIDRGNAGGALATLGKRRRPASPPSFPLSESGSGWRWERFYTGQRLTRSKVYG